MKQFYSIVISAISVFSYFSLHTMNSDALVDSAITTMHAIKKMQNNLPKKTSLTLLNTAANTAIAAKKLNELFLLMNELTPLLQSNSSFTQFNKHKIFLGSLNEGNQPLIKSELGDLLKWSKSSNSDDIFYSYVAQAPEEIAFLIRTLTFYNIHKSSSAKKIYLQTKNKFAKYENSPNNFIKNLSRNLLYTVANHYYKEELSYHQNMIVNHPRYMGEIGRSLKKAFPDSNETSLATFIKTTGNFKTHGAIFPLYTTKGNDGMNAIDAFITQEKKETILHQISQTNTIESEIVYQIIINTLAQYIRQAPAQKAVNRPKKRAQKTQKKKIQNPFLRIKELHVQEPHTIGSENKLPNNNYSERIADQAKKIIDLAQIQINNQQKPTTTTPKHNPVAATSTLQVETVDTPEEINKENLQPAPLLTTATTTTTTSTTTAPIATPTHTENLPIAYASRVIDQHDLSDIYHSFAWEIDPYIIAHGEKSEKTNKKGNSETLYSMPAQMEWHENGVKTKRFIVITLCMDQNNVVYHRGLVYAKNNFVQNFKVRCNKDIEWPTLQMSAQELQGQKITSTAEAIILKDNEFTTVIFDKNLKRTISLFKINW